jgi:hypothetical protein
MTSRFERSTGTPDLGGFERRLLAELVLEDEHRPDDLRRPTPAGTRRAAGFGRGSRRTIGVGLGVAGALAVGVTAAAAGGFFEPRSLQVDGDTPQGGSVVLKGGGCDPGAGVSARLDGADVAKGQADDEGLFLLQTTLPSDVVVGTHTVVVSCDSGGSVLRQKAALRVVARVRMGPSFAVDAGGSAVVGTVALVKGAGCATKAPVQIALDDRGIGKLQADDAGLFYADLALPRGTALGKHLVTATCADQNGVDLVQTSALQVVRPTPNPAASPAPGQPPKSIKH